MMARLSIVVGLLAGIVAAGLLLGGIYALTPDAQPSVAPPSEPAASSGPSASASVPFVVSPSPTSSASPQPSPSLADGPFHVGQPAPSLIVPTVSGRTIGLTDLRGMPVWVEFMATRCPSCQDESL